eukprot:3187987-Alexandrium_andersonii.AAC.1
MARMKESRRPGNLPSPPMNGTAPSPNALGAHHLRRHELLELHGQGLVIHDEAAVAPALEPLQPVA